MSIKKIAQNNVPAIAEEQVRKTLLTYQGGNSIFEVRVLDKASGAKSGFFTNDEEGISQLMKALSTPYLQNKAIYMTMNQVKKENISVNTGIQFSKNMTKDIDVGKLRFLHIDLDPERATNTQATAGEVKYAEDMMNEIKGYLGVNGFHEPIISFSGNGYNLDYRIDMLNTKENVNILHDMLNRLSDRYSDEHVNVDTTTYNPSRIIKLYGCKSCKGINSTERPYRKSTVLSVPNEIQVNEVSVLRKFLDNNYATRKTTKKTGETVSLSEILREDNRKKKPKVLFIRDTQKWLEDSGIAYKYKDYNGDKMYVLDVCPFNEEHTGGCCFVLEYEERKVMFKCHHAHCSDKTIHDMVKLFPVNQLPLLSGTSEAHCLYNAVLDRVQLLLDENSSTKYVLHKNEVIPFDSNDFTALLYRVGQDIGLLCNSNNITTVKGNISGLFERFGKKCKIGHRIIQTPEAWFYAYMPTDVIEISKGKITNYTGDDEVYFVKSNLIREQIKADLSTSAEQLPNLIRQAFNVEECYLMRFLAQLVCFYMPAINTPLLVLSGSYGTSKSTTARKMRSLIDPSVVDVVSLPDKEDGLASVLSNNYLTVFDNIEKLNTRYSDLLAIACTGGFTSKRKLFSDNDLIQVPLHSKIILNGIGDMVTRPDLAERCNTIYLSKITQRRTEEAVWHEFKKLKPKILGAIFNTIRIGLTLVDEVRENIASELPRMADFCVYGASFIKAMGLDENKFVQEYTDSTSESVAECNETDDFVLLLKDFLKGTVNYEWQGQPNGLLDILKNHARKNMLSIDTNLSASSLSRKLKQNQAVLGTVGILFERKKSSQRYIHLKMSNYEKMPTNTVNADNSKDSKDDNDGIAMKTSESHTDEDLEGW